MNENSSKISKSGTVNFGFMWIILQWAWYARTVRLAPSAQVIQAQTASIVSCIQPALPFDEHACAGRVKTAGRRGRESKTQNKSAKAAPCSLGTGLIVWNIIVCVSFVVDNSRLNDRSAFAYGYFRHSFAWFACVFESGGKRWFWLDLWLIPSKGK